MTIRITDSYMASILIGDLNRSLANMLEQQQMAGSMRRLNSFADDPRAEDPGPDRGFPGAGGLGEDRRLGST